MNNPKHEPVSEDVEREAFEAVNPEAKRNEKHEEEKNLFYINEHWQNKWEGFVQGYAANSVCPECKNDEVEKHWHLTSIMQIEKDSVVPILADVICANDGDYDRMASAVYDCMTQQARAVVKPVQDDALGKLCELRDRAANVTLSVIPELANGLFTENYVVSQKHVKHLAELLSYLDRHGVKPAASTGNTEERTDAEIVAKQVAAWRKEIARLQDLVDTASPSSPLSEEKAVEIMCAEYDRVQTRNLPKASIYAMAEAYRALLSHLSDTSAENRIASLKARCEVAENLSVAMSAHTVALIEYSTKQDARVSGLVEAAKALSLNYNYCCDGAEVVVFAGDDEVIYHGNNKDGEGNGKAFKAIKDFTEALAAFEGGVA